jgi:hypothetical protein
MINGQLGNMLLNMSCCLLEHILTLLQSLLHLLEVIISLLFGESTIFILILGCLEGLGYSFLYFLLHTILLTSLFIGLSISDIFLLLFLGSLQVFQILTLLLFLDPSHSLILDGLFHGLVLLGLLNYDLFS